MKKNYITYLYYIFLSLVVFLAHCLSTAFYDLEALTKTNPQLGWVLLTIWYAVFLYAGDKAISKIFRLQSIK